MTVEELYRWRDEALPRLALRLAGASGNGADAGVRRREVLVCGGGSCQSCGASEVAKAFRAEVAKRGLADRVSVVEVGCIGCCSLGVVVQVVPDDILYRRVTTADAAKICESHLQGDAPVDALLHREGPEGPVYRSTREMPFFRSQVKIVLENCGLIDPERIEDYVARDGYLALARALTELDPGEVVAELETSGLRGRGGGGFPAGRKWRTLLQAEGDRKYVICNADEGDPGAFMDRSVLESDPHRVLEGMAIASYATGSGRGVIYVRAEYPLAIKRLQIAIEQARKAGLLGERVLGSDFTFHVEIRVGAGAFVCGEETALMASVEGRRGLPRPRPPFPTQRGLYGCPTMINNVETFANVPPIIRKGGAWYASIGTKASTGTKVFALTGAVRNTGLVEVPMGTTLRDLVFEVGGGIENGLAFKAAQTGGPSGGCIPAEHLDLPLEFDSLQAIGSIMGSGGLIVLDENSCMVDVARFFMEFSVDESCGKCPPCRVGTFQLHRILTDICEGRARDNDLERLEDLSAVVSRASLCGLGMTAPNPVMSTIRHFRDEYTAHLKEHRCPARSCRKLLTFTITQEACTGCSLCSKNCPVETIFRVDGAKKFRIEQDACIQCGTCFDVCRFGAVEKS